nr:uridine diphosphate-N-acetylglucosamine-binding protein YvcK [Aminiphilus circumscriptus]
MGPQIVAFGGGTGLSTLLRGLKGFTRNLTAVVTVTDEGGSSGRLRQEWGVLPPGDIRNCLVALAEDDSALNRLLSFRFDRGELAGHSLGNLILLAATELAGDFRLAVEEMNNLLAIRGRVLPVTTEAVSLHGRTKENLHVKGELDISRNGMKLEQIWLEPPGATPLPDVLSVVERAEVIVLGPGSLFTSILPNLLLPAVASAIRKSPAPVVYVANLMTQPGETETFSIFDHVKWIARTTRRYPDYVLANEDQVPEAVAKRYALAGARPLYLGEEELENMRRKGINVVVGSFLALNKEKIVRHQSHNLAEAIIRITRESQERQTWKN